MTRWCSWRMLVMRLYVVHHFRNHCYHEHDLILIPWQAKDAAQAEHDSWLNDKSRARRLRRKMDLRILPLCAWMVRLAEDVSIPSLYHPDIYPVVPIELSRQRKHRKLQTTQLRNWRFIDPANQHVEPAIRHRSLALRCRIRSIRSAI
jgi:hypothetical protein